MPGRSPWKNQPRDTSAHVIIEKYLREHGADSEVKKVIPMPGHAAANQGRLSLNRGARHFGVSPSAWVVDQDGRRCADGCPDPQAPHAVVFLLWSAASGRAHVYRQAGGNPDNLKYNPHRKGRRRR